ncbi:hypothetical protein ABKV19_001866, partial [Rosa sericea]
RIVWLLKPAANLISQFASTRNETNNSKFRNPEAKALKKVEDKTKVARALKECVLHQISEAKPLALIIDWSSLLSNKNKKTVI